MTQLKKLRAFTLVEMLLVVAIISILAAGAIAHFANAAQESRDIVTRQQLAVVQEAVNTWAAKQIGLVTTSGSPGKTIISVMNEYNTPTTVTGRFNLFKSYLDDQSQTMFSGVDSTGRLTTQAMRDTGRYLLLPDWAAGSYPKVELYP